MMKKVVMVATILCVVATTTSCIKMRGEENLSRRKIVKIDSCEYILWHHERNSTLTHKEDCSYHKQLNHCMFCHTKNYNE